MAYPKIGPFTNNVASPPIDAGFLNGLEAAMVGVTNGPVSLPNPATGWFHCDAYGAVGDGSTLARTAIQAALNAAGNAYTATGAYQRVYLPAGVFVVDATTYLNDDSSSYGAVSLMLPSGVDFCGPGTLRVKAGAYGSGALFAVIRSKSGGITGSKVREITIDGNKGNNVASQQCSNLYLIVLDDVEVADTRNVNANGNGMLLTGPSSSTQMTNVRIRNNRVAGATMVGIQASQFSGLDIIDNIVTSCGNNGIDVYGENGSANSSGVNFRIVGNHVNGCAVGIFPETVAYGLISSNYCGGNTESGIHVNRINGAPTAITLSNNQCTSQPIGIYITGDMGSIYIRGNTIASVTSAGIQMGGGGANLSHVYIDSNFIDTATPNNTALILVANGTNTWSQSFITRTITQNSNRSYDLVNYASSTVGVAYNPANAT